MKKFIISLTLAFLSVGSMNSFAETANTNTTNTNANTSPSNENTKVSNTTNPTSKNDQTLSQIQKTIQGINKKSLKSAETQASNNNSNNESIKKEIILSTNNNTTGSTNNTVNVSNNALKEQFKNEPVKLDSSGTLYISKNYYADSENWITFDTFKKLVADKKVSKVVYFDLNNTVALMAQEKKSDDPTQDTYQFTYIPPINHDVDLNGIEYSYIPKVNLVDLDNVVEIKKSNAAVSFFKENIFGFLRFFVFIFFFMLMIIGAMFLQMYMMEAMANPNSNKKVKTKVSFEDIKGLQQEKEEVQEVIYYLKNRKAINQYGAKNIKGILFHGDPGNGKTLLAKAIAHEAKVPFYYASGSQFVQMFVGMGAARIRNLFKKAKKNAPCIIFIDEIDSFGLKRGSINSHNENDTTLNQLLTYMDGLEESSGVIVIAATNRVDALDPALLRPGRFDRQIHIRLPGIEDRKEILEHYLKNKKTETLDLDSIARITVGFSAAKLAALVNEAALIGARESKGINQSYLQQAYNKLVIGLPKENLLPEKIKTRIAYHEMGHTFMAMSQNPKSVEQVTIIPAGQSLGSTLHIPQEENLYLYNKQDLIEKIEVLLGGRAAEEVFLGEISSGASQDLQQATKIIYQMIVNWGMEPKFGLVSVDDYRSLSSELQKKVDEIAKQTLDEVYQQVLEKLNTNRDLIDKVVKVLLDKKTLTQKELIELMK
jgi:cell division protease FtsH